MLHTCGLCPCVYIDRGARGSDLPGEAYGRLPRRPGPSISRLFENGYGFADALLDLAPVRTLAKASPDSTQLSGSGAARHATAGMIWLAFARGGKAFPRAAPQSAGLALKAWV